MKIIPKEWGEDGTLLVCPNYPLGIKDGTRVRQRCRICKRSVSALLLMIQEERTDPTKHIVCGNCFLKAMEDEPEILRFEKYI